MLPGSSVAVLIPSLPPSTAVGKSSIESPLPIKRGDKSGCYSPKVIGTSGRHGKVVLTMKYFDHRCSSLGLSHPPAVLFTHIDLKQRCHLILYLNLAPWGQLAATVSWQRCLFVPFR